MTFHARQLVDVLRIAEHDRIEAQRAAEAERAGLNRELQRNSMLVAHIEELGSSLEKAHKAWRKKGYAVP